MSCNWSNRIRCCCKTQILKYLRSNIMIILNQAFKLCKWTCLYSKYVPLKAILIDLSCLNLQKSCLKVTLMYSHKSLPDTNSVQACLIQDMSKAKSFILSTCWGGWFVIYINSIALYRQKFFEPAKSYQEIASLLQCLIYWFVHMKSLSSHISSSNALANHK